jgi:hypothetical protein
MRDLALGRMKTGSMNKSEAEYATILEAQKNAGFIKWYRFEGIKLRLADNTFYTPDFVLMNDSNIIECHEVKGFWRDDAKVKIKIAAEMYPFKFLAVLKQAKKRGGGWKSEEF